MPTVLNLLVDSRVSFQEVNRSLERFKAWPACVISEQTRLQRVRKLESENTFRQTLELQAESFKSLLWTKANALLESKRNDRQMRGEDLRTSNIDAQKAIDQKVIEIQAGHLKLLRATEALADALRQEGNHLNDSVACKKIQLNKLKNDAEPTTDILFPACTAESERLQMRRGILNNRIDTEKRAIGSISKRISEIRAHKVAFDAVLQDENSTVDGERRKKRARLQEDKAMCSSEKQRKAIVQEVHHENKKRAVISQLISLLSQDAGSAEEAAEIRKAVSFRFKTTSSGCSVPANSDSAPDSIIVEAVQKKTGLRLSKQ